MTPVERLRGFLSALGDDYAVLKNPDLWANLQRGGDWDLVVRDVDAARSALWTHVGLPDRWVARSYVDSSFYAWGHIDLLPSISWRGLELAGATRILASATQEAGIRVSSPAIQLVASCIHPLIAYGEFNARYLPTLSSPSTVKQALATVGPQIGPTAQSMLLRFLQLRRRSLTRGEITRLRVHTVRGGFSSRAFSLQRFGRFLVCELAERQTGPRVHLVRRRSGSVELVTRYHERADRAVTVIPVADLWRLRALRAGVRARRASQPLLLQLE